MVKGFEDYVGELTIAYTIARQSEDLVAQSKGINNALTVSYNGSDQKPTLEVKVKQSAGEYKTLTATDYEVVWPDDMTNVDWTESSDGTRVVADKPIAVKGAGEYADLGATMVEGFKITQADLSSATIGSISSQTFSGNAIEPAPTVTWRATSSSTSRTLVSGKDYTLSYKNNKAIGTASVIITGKGSKWTKLRGTVDHRHLRVDI